MTRTRLKTVWVFGFIISLLTGFAIYNNLPAVATIGMAGLSGIVAHYMHSETKRKSNV